MVVNTVPDTVTDGAIRDVLSAGISAINIRIGHVSGILHQLHMRKSWRIDAAATRRNAG